MIEPKAADERRKIRTVLQIMRVQGNRLLTNVEGTEISFVINAVDGCE